MSEFRLFDGAGRADENECTEGDDPVAVAQDAKPEPVPEPSPGPEKKTGRWGSVYNAAKHWLTSKLLWIPGEVKGVVEDLRKGW